MVQRPSQSELFVQLSVAQLHSIKKTENEGFGEQEQEQGETSIPKKDSQRVDEQRLLEAATLSLFA